MSETTINVLDKGFVRLVDYMGSDSRIVDAARVSYQQGTKAVQTDRHLIRYLLRNLHTSPFEKCVFEFHIKCPVFVARQWLRHRTASINEISARYSEMPDEFYEPDFLRGQSAINRQGSSELALTDLGDQTMGSIINAHDQKAYSLYRQLLKAGVAREQARMVLPVNLYTEFYWTMNLWNLFHFLHLRLDAHAQEEIRVYAEAIVRLVETNCELKFAMEAFKDYIVEKPNISKFEFNILKRLLRQSGLQQSDLEGALEEACAAGTIGLREKKESKLNKLFQVKEENE